MDYFKISKFFLYLIPFSVVIVSVSTLFPFIVGKYVFFRATVGLALIFFLLGLLFQNKLSVIGRQLSVIFKRPLVVAVFLFVLIFVLAGFFGVDPSFSFWSNFERGEGGLQMLCLGIFFLLISLLFKEEKDWRLMFWVSIVAALLMIFYGIGAGLKYLDAETIIRNIGGVPQKTLTGEGGFLYQTFKSFVGPDFRETGVRFAGSIGNPAYVSTYLVFILFYCLFLFIDYAKEKKKNIKNLLISPKIIFLTATAAIFIVFFFLAATRGAFIGLIAALLFLFLYLGFSIKTWRKRLSAIIVLLLLAVGVLIYFKDASLVKSLPGSRIFDISFRAENFQNRIVIWKIAVDGFKERSIFGWGPENFMSVFDKYYNPKHYSVRDGFGAWYDRAHNIYLDYLIQAGILGLLSFLGIFAVFYRQLLKLGIREQGIENRKKELKNKGQETVNGEQKKNVPSSKSPVISSLLFSLPIAYLIQGLVLFDILPTYINLFLFLGFAAHKFSENNREN